MLNGIRDSLSDLENYDHELDGKDEDHDEDDPVGGKLRKNNEPGWVMDTISETVQYRMECFRQKQMKLGELVQPGRGDSVDYICERDKMYGMTELMVPAVIQSPTADDAGLSALTTFAEPIKSLDRVPGKLRMSQVTSRPGSSHMRLGLRKHQTHEPILSLRPAPMPGSSADQESKHVKPVGLNPCISHPRLISI